MRLPPQLKRRLGDIVVGQAAIHVVQAPQPGNIRHGLNIEYQHGTQNNSFKNKYLYYLPGKTPVDR